MSQLDLQKWRLISFGQWKLSRSALVFLEFRIICELMTLEKLGRILERQDGYQVTPLLSVRLQLMENWLHLVAVCRHTPWQVSTKTYITQNIIFYYLRQGVSFHI